jgi:hypothetical protein
LGFSFSGFGFWKLTTLALLVEMLHMFLQWHWPEIRGSRLGLRSPIAVAFMSGEAVIVLAALAAGIGTISNAIQSRTTDAHRLLPIGIAMIVVIFVFFWFCL